jgi:hypothetical protein
MMDEIPRARARRTPLLHLECRRERLRRPHPEANRDSLHESNVSFVDHLSPFACFGDDELVKFGRRSAKHYAAEIGKFLVHSRIRERLVDRFVQALDDFGPRTALSP